MSKRPERPFFVGYLSIPAGLRLFLAAIAVGLMGGFAALAFTTGTSIDDPGNGAFRFDWRRQTVTGILEAKPYPILHITQGNDRLPTGKTIMLAGQGKRGVQRRAARLDGSLVEASGIAIQRGELVTLQVAGGQRGLKMVSPAVADSPNNASQDTASGETIAAPAPDQPGATAIPSEQLGRWRLAGEMCDGKCLSGAMRPG
ncbi:MAG: hypothetical protein AAGF32_09650, partial [Pseudomonadota bacterium]